MRKRIMFLPFGVFATVSGLAQQATTAVIATAGDVSKTPTMSIQWTVGEPVIETGLTTNYLLTQGFHQPLLNSKLRPPLNTSPPGLVSVMVLPNPVQSTCRVFITGQAETTHYLELTDARGQKVYNTTAKGKLATVNIDLTGYASGTYLLSVRDAKGLLFKTSKVVKTH